jgi:hypothetical protein
MVQFLVFSFINGQGLNGLELAGNGRSPSPAPASNNDLSSAGEDGRSPAPQPTPSPLGDKPGVLKAKSATKGRRKSVESAEPVDPSVKIDKPQASAAEHGGQ